MSTTTLDPQFLQAALLVTSFKGKRMLAVQGALLHLALSGRDFTAAEIPDVLVNGSKNLAGCASGALVAQGLLIVVARVPSPKPNAKGRKLDLFRLAPNKYETALTFLERNGLPRPSANQQIELAIQPLHLLNGGE